MRNADALLRVTGIQTIAQSVCGPNMLMCFLETGQGIVEE